MSSKQEFLSERLEQIQETHRRRHLSERLDEVGETMEATILKRELAEAFFEENLPIDEDAKAAVSEVQELLEREDYDAVESRIDSLEQTVNTVETQVDNTIQELRISRNEVATAMKRLNDRVERVAPVQIQALSVLLDDWQWRNQVYPDGDATASLDQLKANAREYGTQMRNAFTTLREDLFGEYPSEIRDLVHKMIEGERLAYADLDADERELLAKSDIGQYIGLRLS